MLPPELLTSSRSQENRARLAIEWLVALVVAAVALAIFFNGSFFSSWNALHIDLSINITAAHAMRDGMNPYGPSTLADLAARLGGPTALIYGQLFTSYIQPPTSGLSLLPLTALSWRDATQAYLLLNHVCLFAAVGISLYTLRPTLPLRWVIAGAAVILATYSQVNMSFALGQVDASILLLLSIGFWGYCRNRPAVAGSAIACAAAIKLVPGLLLIYLLWKRQYAAVAWGAGVGLALFLASLAYLGPDVYKTYLNDTLPALSKGSTHYSNAGFGAVIARANTPEVIRDQAAVFYLDEVPGSTATRIASIAVTLIGVAIILALTRPLRTPAGRRPERLIFEYYFVVLVGLLVSSVTWEFYVIWLLPVFLAVFLAFDRVLPGSPWRWPALAAFAVALIALNFPGDFYLFDRNDFFYHPEWVAGVWVEDHLQLYHKHLDAVLYLRLSAMLLLAGLMAALIVWNRRSLRDS